MSDARRDDPERERERDRRLSVDADLALDVDGAAARVIGHGDLIVVEAPSIRAARALVRGARALALPTRLRSRLGDGLARADLRIDLRVRGASVARAGAGVDAGLGSRLLGLGAGLRARSDRPPEGLRPSLGGLAVAALRALRR